MRRTRFIVAATLVLAVGLAVGVWLTRPAAHSGSAHAHEEHHRLAQDSAASPLVPISSREAVLAALANTPHGSPPGIPHESELPRDVGTAPPSAAAHNELLDHLATFFTLLASGSAPEYEAWARSRGYSLDEELYDTALAAFRYYDEEEPVGENTHAELFRAIFPASLAFAGGQLTPAALSTAENTSRIRYLRLRPVAVSENTSSTFFYAPEEIERWIGFAAMGANRHWRPPISARAIAERDGDVLSATVSLTVQSASGSWVPTNLVMYHDPDPRVWHTQAITIVNAPDLQATWQF